MNNLYVKRPSKPINYPSHDVHMSSISLMDSDQLNSIRCLITDYFYDHSKFLTIWPHVRYIAYINVYNRIQSMALVSDTINWQIDYVSTNINFRHKGYASSIMTYINNVAWDKGVPYLILTSNSNLEYFYTKLGYSRVL